MGGSIFDTCFDVSAGVCTSRELGTGCESDSDCDSNKCWAGLCETDGPGSPCGSGSDCRSNSCTMGICD